MALIPVSRELHGKTRIRPISSFAFAAATTAVPVHGSELVSLSHEVPIVFIRDASGYVPAALFGLRNGQNLFVDPSGRWIGAHVPAIWRRGPFRLARVEGEGEARMVLCLDDGSDLINESEGLPLFDESGAPSALIGTATNLLSQMERDARATQTVCALLEQLGLFIPWALDITQPDGQKQRVSDLFQVDEAKIATLSSEDLVRVRDIGGLPLIYAHLLSLFKVSMLGRLAKLASERDQQHAALQKGSLNLDRAFGIVEDDPFMF